MTPTNEAGHGLPELPVPWADYWASKGNWALSHNYAAFELADEWLRANIAALALSRGAPADMVLVPRELTTSMAEAAEQEFACGNDFSDAWEAAIATYLFDKESSNG